MRQADEFVAQNFNALCKDLLKFRDTGVRNECDYLNRLCAIYQRIIPQGWLRMAEEAIKWKAVEVANEFPQKSEHTQADYSG